MQQLYANYIGAIGAKKTPPKTIFGGEYQPFCEKNGHWRFVLRCIPLLMVPAIRFTKCNYRHHYACSRF
mgnify:FL=1